MQGWLQGTCAQIETEFPHLVKNLNGVNVFFRRAPQRIHLHKSTEEIAINHIAGRYRIPILPKENAAVKEFARVILRPTDAGFRNRGAPEVNAAGGRLVIHIRCWNTSCC